jgi:methylenetetrahydrofolate reductase (NADPH)
MPREKIDIALETAKASGVQNILALRGDAPRGQKDWTSVDTGFSHASDLVTYIKQKYGDYFCISVAGYVEGVCFMNLISLGHPDSPDRETDLKWMKAKVDAGADYIVTQFFYDTDLFLEWVGACRAYGILCPILPGMMIIQGYERFKRMVTLAKTQVPGHVYQSLEPIKYDDQAVKDYGVSMMIEMCQRLMAGGINEFHFYTGNLEKSARLILEGLGFVPEQEKVRQLPWARSLAKNRGEKESVRPIFWRNKPKSYITRTQDWDEFPNGRWGDSRSPAFGDIDNYGTVYLKYPRDECLKMWRSPETTFDISQVFVDYISGSIASLPWCDSPLQAESGVLQDRLITLNRNGFLTINSQPAIDGALSSDKTFGWGPKNGFVYQKAYIELFLTPKALDVLMDKISASKYPYVTFYGVNDQVCFLFC